MSRLEDEMTTPPDPATCAAALVTPGWLDAHLHDPAVRVVEVDIGRPAYDEWHIPGAVLWNVYADLKDADYRLTEAAAVPAAVRPVGDPPGRPSCSTGTRPPWDSGS